MLSNVPRWLVILIAVLLVVVLLGLALWLWDVDVDSRDDAAALSVVPVLALCGFLRDATGRSLRR